MAFAFCKLGADGEKARGIQRAFGVNVADKAGCTLGLKGKRIPNFARDAAVQKLFLYRLSGGIVSLTAIAGEDQDFHMASTFFPVRSVTGAASSAPAPHGMGFLAERARASRPAAQRRGRL